MLRPVVICSTFVEKEGKFLAVFCPKFKKWRVPGGKVDGTETLIETVKREMKEETNLDIENPIFLGYGQDDDYNHHNEKKIPRLIMFFHAKTNQEVTMDPEEAEEFKWVTMEELKKLDIEGALQDFFSRNPSFPQ